MVVIRWLSDGGAMRATGASGRGGGDGPARVGQVPRERAVDGGIGHQRHVGAGHLDVARHVGAGHLDVPAGSSPTHMRQSTMPSVRVDTASVGIDAGIGRSRPRTASQRQWPV